MCHKLVVNSAKVSNMFKNFMRIFSPKYFTRLSHDIRRTTFAARHLPHDIRASVANLSPQNFAEFTMQNFLDTRTNAVQVSYDGHTTSLEKTCLWRENKLSDIRMNVV